MAAILRLAVHHSDTLTEYGYGTPIFTATVPQLISVIATNRADEAQNFSIYTVPAGTAETPSEWGIINYNLPISPFNAYETFRFGLNPNDTIYVSGSPNISFFVQGITQ